MELTFERVPLDLQPQDWGRWGKAKLTYFNFKTYFLPTCVAAVVTPTASALPQTSLSSPLSLSSSHQSKRGRERGEESTSRRKSPSKQPRISTETETGNGTETATGAPPCLLSPLASMVTVGDLVPWMVDGIQSATAAAAASHDHDK